MMVKVVKKVELFSVEHGDWYIDDFKKIKGDKVVYSNRAEAETYLENH